MRIQQLVLAINKMGLIHFDNGRFDSIASGFADSVKSLVFEVGTATPVSASGGDIVVGRSGMTV